jgi:hypothetical protein
MKWPPSLAHAEIEANLEARTVFNANGTVNARPKGYR